LAQPIDDVLGEDLSFEARLIGAAGADFEGGGQFSGERSGIFETLMGVVEVVLLSNEFGVNDDLRFRCFWGESMVARLRSRASRVRTADETHCGLT